MTPQEFLRYQREELRRKQGLIRGSATVDPDGDETVGVVLLGPGGPQSRDDLEDFLFSYYMDPLAVRLGGVSFLRKWLSRYLASRRSKSLSEQYDAIGGKSLVNRMATEQAAALEQALNRRYGTVQRFRVLVSMRYGQPSARQAMDRLAAEGITKIVLLPQYPQYSTATTGSALAYWDAVATVHGSSVQSAAVPQFAVEPRFIEALSERVDEGLQRFPRARRSAIPLVFVATGEGSGNRRVECNPYCCLVNQTAHAVMKRRDEERAFHVAFQEQDGSRERPNPRLSGTLKKLGSDGTRDVLLVPIGFTTEHLESAYRLDVVARRHAEKVGISGYEIAAPLNCHPLLIEALGDAVARRIRVDGAALRSGTGREGGCPSPEWMDEKEGRTCSRCPFRGPEGVARLGLDSAA